MDLKDYKAGKFTDQSGYKCFRPGALNREWNLNHPELAVLLEEANLAEYHKADNPLADWV